jgi:tetratricopeptide (TPR) repeat protein
LDIDPNLVGACGGLSIVYTVTKEHAKAIEMANTALKINQHHPSGHYAMSKIMYYDGKYDKALEHINVAIRLYSRYPYFYIDRADIYMKLKNSKAALKDYTL